MTLWRRNVLFTVVLGICGYVFKRPQICHLGVDSETYLSVATKCNYRIIKTSFGNVQILWQKMQIAGRLWAECMGNNESESTSWTEKYSMGVNNSRSVL
jgi:hypothetical protein